jgi:2-succinyl-5-enolpyruvyl-6-hydroxy-3-cyclohexene-1-carboxylate synthase
LAPGREPVRLGLPNNERTLAPFGVVGKPPAGTGLRRRSGQARGSCADTYLGGYWAAVVAPWVANRGLMVEGGMVRRQLGYWVVMAVLAAGCAASDAHAPSPATDEADVWFMQHLAGHLLQQTAILDLGHDRITHPNLAQLANTINQQGQAHLTRIQEWLTSRGLAPYDPQQEPAAARKATLSDCRGSMAAAST